MKFLLLFTLLFSTHAFSSLDLEGKIKFHSSCNEHKRTIVITSLNYGLKRLLIIRSDLNEKIANLKRVKIKCKKSLKVKKQGSLAEYFFFSHKIQFHHKTLLKAFDQTSIGSEYISYVRENREISFQTNPFTDILHEFLHALKVDNQSKKEHSKFLAFDLETKFKDHIYSCSEVSIPAGDLSYILFNNIQYSNRYRYSKKNILKLLGSCCKGIAKSTCSKRVKYLIQSYKYENLHSLKPLQAFEIRIPVNYSPQSLKNYNPFRPPR